MRLLLRRWLVVAGVIVCLVAGVASIRAAAALTAAAAPPPAPPVSIESLQAALAAEQARRAALEEQLDELDGIASSLSGALGMTGDQVAAEALTATDLAHRLEAAQARLEELKSLLSKARRRLAQLDASRSSGSGGGGGGGGSGGAQATPKPSGMSLTVSLAGGGVKLDWSSCNPSGFVGYAVVRSTDHELHWPPEDRDTEVARITSRSTTAWTDDGAPSGTLSYQVYCLYQRESETKFYVKSPTRSITVP